MSISSGINIDFSQTRNKPYSVIIKKLIMLGWRMFNDGLITYLPTGDNGDYNWISDNTGSINIEDIISHIQLAGETVGIILYWQDTDVGASFLFDKNKILIGLDINRKIIEELKITDVNWYLERLSPIFNEFNDDIEAIEFYEHK